MNLDLLKRIRCIILVGLVVASPAQAQRFLNESTDGVACWANTAKDGSGTDYQTLVDADGHLQVDVLSGGGAGTQHTEDSVHSTGAEGSLSLAVRNDSASSLCGTDGDYCPLNTDSTGALRVTSSGGGGGGTEYTTNDAAPTNPVGGTIVAERDDALSTLSEVAGDWTNARATAEGALWTQDANSDAILSDTNSLAGTVSGSELQVDIVSSAAVPVTDNAGSLTVDGTVTSNLSATDNAVLDSIDTDLTTLAGAVSGSEIQVDIVSGGGGGTQFNEDTAHTTADAGTQTLTVRQDTPAALSGTSGDYQPLITGNAGHLWVYDANSDDMASSLSNMETALDYGGEKGSGVELNALRVTIASDSTGLLSVDDNGGSLTVDGTLTCNAGTNLNTSALALDSSVDGIEALLTTIDSDTGGILADTAAIQTAVQTLDNAISGSEMQVDIVSAPTLTVDLGSNNDIVGQTADDAAASGNPVTISGYAIETDGTDPGDVSAEGDTARLRTDLNRRLLVNTMHPNWFKASENHATAQTNNELVADPGNGFQICITDVIISCGATAGSVKLVETTGTPVDVLEELYCPINGGAVMNFTTPLCISASENLGFTSTTVTTHSVTVTGFRQAT